MEVPIVISGGGIIGNYISLRLEKNNIKTVIVESIVNGSGWNDPLAFLTVAT